MCHNASLTYTPYTYTLLDVHTSKQSSTQAQCEKAFRTIFTNTALLQANLNPYNATVKSFIQLVLPVFKLYQKKTHSSSL